MLEKRDDENASEGEDTYILDTIESFGKGRFAQRLAPKLTKDRIPTYIENAINHILESVTRE